MAGQFLTLALFLMLLSFFIVLNAISSYQDLKAKPVMNSLSLAFSTSYQQDMEDSPATQSSSTSEMLNSGDTLEQIQRLFEAHIVGAEISEDRFGKIMHVRLPLRAFDKAMAQVKEEGLQSSGHFGQRKDGDFLAPSLVSLLVSAYKGVPYRMEMLLNTPEPAGDIEKGDPPYYQELLTRVSGYAQTLEDVGLPVKLLNIGFIKGDPDYIDVYFKRYEPFTLPAEELKSALPQEDQSPEGGATHEQ